MKKILLVLFLIMGILFLGNKLFSTTLAYSYDIDNSVLFYKDNSEELEKDIKKYIDNIDDLIVSNSSYLYSDKLVNNYDFLVRFALDYVLDNKEYYYNDIKFLDSCLYYDKDVVQKSTSDYIDLDIIYKITDFYFGIKDFSIINDDVCLMNDYISLSNYNVNRFKDSIKEIEVVSYDDGVLKVLVLYEGDNKYLYSFINHNNVLKIFNVEVIL